MKNDMAQPSVKTRRGSRVIGASGFLGARADRYEGLVLPRKQNEVLKIVSGALVFDSTKEGGGSFMENVNEAQKLVDLP